MGTVNMVSVDSFQVPAQDLAEGTLFIEINNSLLYLGIRISWKIGVYSGGRTDRDHGNPIFGTEEL